MGIPVMAYIDQKTGMSYVAGEPKIRFCAARNQ
jgi:hypothetical protein